MKLRQYIREKLQLQRENGGNAISGIDFFNFFNQNVPAAKLNTLIVKAAKFSVNQNVTSLECTFDVKNEFFWDPHADKIVISYKEDAFGTDEETKALSLTTDLNGIFDAKNDAREQPVYIAQEGNERQIRPVLNMAWDDNSNVLYLVYTEDNAQNVKAKAAANADLVFSTHVRLIHDITNEYKLDTEALHRAIDLATKNQQEDNIIAIRQLMNPNDKYGNDKPNGDAADEQKIKGNQDEPRAEKHAEPENKAAKDETLNGMQYKGVAGADIINGIIGHNWKYAIALSPLTEEEFKRQIMTYPRQAVEKFSDMPVYYKHIDGGEAKDPTHNALRYFFIFNNFNTVVWKQIRKGRTGVLKTDLISPAVFEKLLAKPGSAWKSLFYRETSRLIKDGHFEVLYADADGYVEAKDGNVLPVIDGKINGSQPPAAENGNVKIDKRTITVRLLTQRLKDELVAKGFEIDRRIAANPPPGKKRGKTLVYGKDFDPHRREFFGPWHKFTDEDAVNLANSFDNWFYTGYDANVAKTLTRVMDITTLNVDAELAAQNANLFKRDLQKFNDERLDAVQANVEARVAKSMKIVRVNLVIGDANRTENIPDDGKSYFNVKLPGNGKIKFEGDESKKFLQRFRLWQRLEPIYQDAAEKIENLQLIVTMDSKLEK